MLCVTCTMSVFIYVKHIGHVGKMSVSGYRYYFSLKNETPLDLQVNVVYLF